MKGNKKILVIAILLLLISVGFTTYAIYRSTTTATGTVGIAAWHVEIDDNDIDTNATMTLTLDNITWTTQTSAVDDKIAPGSEGYVEIPVDATGSEVPVIIEAAIDTANMTLPTGMTATVDAASQKINYAASNMVGAVRINIVWTGTTADAPAKDTSDKAAATAGTVSIPVTLTARQALSGE